MDDIDFNADLIALMKRLWSDGGVQACFGRSREYQFIFNTLIKWVTPRLEISAGHWPVNFSVCLLNIVAYWTCMTSKCFLQQNVYKVMFFILPENVGD